MHNRLLSTSRNPFVKILSVKATISQGEFGTSSVSSVVQQKTKNNLGDKGTRLEWKEQRKQVVVRNHREYHS